MRTFTIPADEYPELQRAVDAAFEDTLIKNNHCEHILPPDMEADGNGNITLRVKEWIYQLEGMSAFLDRFS